jgi:hypothetical protein
MIAAAGGQNPSVSHPTFVIFDSSPLNGVRRPSRDHATWMAL